MPKLITVPKSIESVGNIPAKIDEYIGRVNSGTYNVSVTRVISPKGWQRAQANPQIPGNRFYPERLSEGGA